MDRPSIHHMRTKILLLCIFSTVLALFLQSIFFQRSASAIVYEQERAASFNALKNLQDELYALIKSYENNLIKIYSRDDFIRDLSIPAPSRELARKYDRLASDIALTVFQPKQDVGAIYVYTMDEELISQYRFANTPRYNYPSDIYDDPVRNNAELVRSYAHSDNRIMLVSSYFNPSRERNLIRFVLKIYSSNVTETIGYVVCDIDPANFTRTLEKYTYAPKQTLWLQPAGDRTLLQHGVPDEAVEEFHRRTIERILMNRPPEGQDSVMHGSVFLSLPQEKYNLTAFALTPQYLLEESQTVLRKNMLIIATMVVAIAIAAAFLISQGLTTPLRKMAGSLERIKGGETNVRLQGLKPDEIGELGRTINEMLDRIQQLVAQEYHLEMLLKQAAYRTLQAQVNPHFLYNSLDTMSGIAGSQDCHAVSYLCTALSNMFRYSVDTKDPLATISAEIVHIKNYMYVMNTRMEDGVELDMDFDEEVMDAMIPRLTLQPIVENSLNHGLRNTRGTKSIRITGRRKGDDVEISVTDNGAGLDADEVNARILAGPEETLEMTSSIGLANIGSRMRLLFGEEYGVRVSGEKGSGTEVTLLLPMSGAKPVGL